MLFNSFGFLLVFLPLALAGWWGTARFAPHWRLHVLAGLSLAFYSVWDWRYCLLLTASIALNWAASRAFVRTLDGRIPLAAIIANLAVLAWFKYAGFAVASANSLFGLSWLAPEWALPLGISFFTFHHVMYLVDLKRGIAQPLDALRYSLYIGFFPQLLAGPLVRWSEIVHQFDLDPFREGALERLTRGLILVIIGLSKKVFLGDPLAELANPVFADAAAGKAIGFLEAWQGTLAFGFQIYFDFSAYTDIAIGVALMMGFLLPQNFFVPYRAPNLQDFWRRWHATLSRFLRDYLYIPLGGNRSGYRVQALALTATMALGGLWHGAGWTFVFWGLAHGLGLAVCVLWRKRGLPMWMPLGVALTFLFVMLCWPLFRAQSLEAATAIYEGLIGLSGFGERFRFRLILVAALVAMIGPTAFDFSQKVYLPRWFAILLGLVLAAVLVTIGDDATYEFIYFQF